MPGQGKYTKYDPQKSDFAKGVSSAARLKKLFNSDAELTDTTLLFAKANAKLLAKNSNGVQQGDPQLFSEGVDLTFSRAPDLSTVKTGGGGLPSTPYTPNLTSPGEVNGVDPTKQADMKISDTKELSVTAQPGVNGLVNPSEVSTKIGSTVKIDAIANPLVFGAHAGGTPPGVD